MSISNDSPFYPQSYRSELSLRNKIGRALWGVAWTLLFRPSPRPCFGWRRWLVKCFGGKIAPDAVIYPSARIYAPWNLEMGPRSCLGDFVDCYCVDKIRLGADAIVSQYAFLCTAGHDIDSPARTLTTGPITLKPGAWVFARAFIGPGVTIHRGAVVAACSVVVKDVASMTVIAGNPARVIRQRKDF
ncbi:MAG: putative colanic acid biosynthesis acetyltransferase [Verrucomicrobiota bacterium JB024]|nr:putative colanic acid biosynthesis acetyltransferase [Verrucomicrobiota bacterium JB024]